VKSFICERENFVLNSLINVELVQKFKARRNVIKLMSSGDSTSSSI
jgi:hypothetical protein